MTTTFPELIDDIEKMKEKELRSIKAGAELRVIEVDRERERVIVRSCVDGSESSRPFRELHKIWSALIEKALTDEPWVHVESILGGSGSKRNQPETVFINLPYVAYCWHQKKKHIAYVGRDVHQSGSPLEMTEEEINSALAGFRERIREKSLCGKARNLIYFGAPGTGKSYQLDKLAKKSFAKENIRRVTFHPDYTYSQFVGGYRPFPIPNKEGKPTGEITYTFIPGPFLRTYVQAVQNPTTPYLLIIEEINRANPAAVFGDLFQLLDRGGDGRSVYDLSVPAEMQLYFKWRIPEFHTNDQMGLTHEEHLEYDQEEERLFDEVMRISIPDNMYIWATMNSADQGVFPMDTAFKRRWNFKYIDINAGASDVLEDGRKISEIEVPIKVNGTTVHIVWDKLRRKINELLKKLKVNEDKFLGPFFISPSDLGDRFSDVFKDKVLLYLYEDIRKLKRGQLFRDESATYSELCKQFANEGITIFSNIELADVTANKIAKDDAAEVAEKPEE